MKDTNKNQKGKQKKEQFPILIAFTDEKGGTTKEVEQHAAKEILDAKKELFASQIDKLNVDNWRILKSVGDQLVLRFNGNRKDKEIAQITTYCLKNLYDAWFSLKPGLRIAVHTPPQDMVGWASGKDIDDYLKRGLEDAAERANKKLGELWPSSAFLNEDIFGSEMTLTARLVALMKGSLFIITEDVVELCTEDILRSSVSSWKATLSPPVPLVSIKGFETRFHVNEPLYIREIRSVEGGA